MNKLQIRARLLEQGLSLRQFALQSGYEPRTLTQVMDRWVGADTLPNGRVAFSIMRALSLQVGTELIPGLLSASEQNWANSTVNHQSGKQEHAPAYS